MADQAEQHQKWWQQLKKHRVAIRVGAIVLVVVIALIIIGYWFDWTGFNGYNQVTITRTISGTNAGTVTKTEEYQPGKGLWDWLQLLGILAIPVVVGFGAAWFTTRQDRESEANREKRHQTDLEILADNQHETVFRAYLNTMSELLTEKKLDESAPEDPVRKIARVQTLEVLLGLDSKRKGRVLQFLYESGLIEKDASIIGLKGVDLSAVILYEADLSGTSLWITDLREADLSEANLYRADLRYANLSSTNLSLANLSGADLSGAILIYAEMDRVNLTDAKLRNAKMWNVKFFSSTQHYFGLKMSADLTRADLTGTLLDDADLRHVRLKGAQLKRANLPHARLIGAELNGADFSNANLSNADLRAADLSNALQLHL